jgi:hypothetical protein
MKTTGKTNDLDMIRQRVLVEKGTKNVRRVLTPNTVRPW